MSVMNGCHDARNMVGIVEVVCPKCKQDMEVFIRDGMLAAEARCEGCDYAIAAGTKAEELDVRG